MKLSLVAALIPLAACGRTGFDVVPDASQPIVACGSTPTITLADNVQTIAATSTPDGYAIFTTDDAHDVNGLLVALAADDATPVAGTQVAKIASAAVGQVGAFTSNRGLVLAVPTGTGTQASGTTIVALSDQLTASTQNPFAGWIAQTGSVAFTTAGVGAYLVQRQGSNDLEASLDPALSQRVAMVTGTPNLAAPTITAAGTQLALTWSDAGVINTQLFGPDLASISPVTKINDAQGAFNPRAAYAVEPGNLLVVWSEKNQDGSDSVKFSLRNGLLGQLASGVITGNGVDPVVVAGEHDFLVTWRLDPAFGAARVSFDGQRITPMSIVTSGGTAIGADLVVHNGQPALIWAERTAGNVRAWINPLCAP
jgi:hypothetical protein